MAQTNKKTKQRGISARVLLLIIVLTNLAWMAVFGLTCSRLHQVRQTLYSGSGGLATRLEDVETALQRVSPVPLRILPESAICKVDPDSEDLVIDAGNAYYDSYQVSTLSCKPGQTYYYTGTRYNYADQYSIIVTDDASTVLWKDLGSTKDETQPQAMSDYAFKIPEGGTKLYIQSYGQLSLKKQDCLDVVSVTDDLASGLEMLELTKLPSYDNTVRSIQRIGEGMGYPVHSLDAYREAYRRGFRILLCDLVFTADNIPVCSHDAYLNQHGNAVLDENGSPVSTEVPVYFAENTYEALSRYSYGAEGYPLLKFTEMLALTKQLGVELYVEVKEMNRDQTRIACELVQRYGLTEQVSWSGTLQTMSWVVENLDTARVSTMPMEITDQVIAGLNTLKTGENQVFIFGWDTTVLTEELVGKLIENDIAFEMGTPKTAREVLDYFARGEAYAYCTGIETEGFIAGKVLLENALNQ